MTVHTKQSILAALPAHWSASYSRNMTLADGRNSADIHRQLLAEQPLTEQRAKEIIGGHGWARNECDECGQDAPVTVTLGQEPDYESATATICVACLQKALAIATQ